MKKFKIIAACVCCIAALTACKNKPVLDAEIEGIGNNEVYLQYASIEDPETITYDTLKAEAGKFTYNPVVNAPVEIIVEIAQDREANRRGVLSSPLSHQMRIWIDKGEKVTLKGKYEEGFLTYELKGSENLAAQSDIREASKKYIKEISNVRREIDRLYAKGVENINEEYVDSLYNVLESNMEALGEQELKYVKDHINSMVSGMYLLYHKNADKFLEYYDKVGSSVKEGVLKARLELAKLSFEKKMQLEKNAADLTKGSVAPDFILKDIDGKDLKLSDFSSRYIVLDFWGTWCPWCIKGIPQMKSYQAKYKNKVEFISIACRDDVDKVRAIVEKEGLNWFQLMNDENNNDVSFMYGVTGYPTKVILSPDLKVVGVFLGEGSDFYEALDSIK